jgi:murein DD-endopeptidase MepM/ murein hydrolase activator NlpD
MKILSFLKEKIKEKLNFDIDFFKNRKNQVKIAAFAAFAATAVYFNGNPQTSATLLGVAPKPMLSELPLKTPNMRYGFNIDTFMVKEAKIGASESLGDFLSEQGINAVQIDKITKNCEGKFDVRTFRTGREYMILGKNANHGDYFCYSPDAYSHLVINLKTLEVNRVQLPMETRIEMSSGVVKSNLWNTMEDNGWSLDIIDKLEDALKCVVDFHHIDEGDKFKLIYEQHYVNGKPVGTGKLLAGYFTDGDKEYHAIWYENGDKIKGHFDIEGRPMKKTFLKSPVKFAHISSGFNMRRLHPVLRYVKPHLGTDFAAATGTPIMAVADGTISEATRKGGNGIYVKMRHDGTYETQYLHMSRHAKGIRPGVRVTQGQTIGYVGSTGLATGPHVCFRFWKNGTQINFQKANLPAPQQMDKNELPKYLDFKEGIVHQLKAIPYKSAAEMAVANAKVVNP